MCSGAGAAKIGAVCCPLNPQEARLPPGFVTFGRDWPRRCGADVLGSAHGSCRLRCRRRGLALCARGLRCGRSSGAPSARGILALCRVALRRVLHEPGAHFSQAPARAARPAEGWRRGLASRDKLMPQAQAHACCRRSGRAIDQRHVGQGGRCVAADRGAGVRVGLSRCMRPYACVHVPRLTATRALARLGWLFSWAASFRSHAFAQFPQHALHSLEAEGHWPRAGIGRVNLPGVFRPSFTRRHAVPLQHR